MESDQKQMLKYIAFYSKANAFIYVLQDVLNITGYTHF